MSTLDLRQSATFNGVAAQASKWAENTFRQIGESLRLRWRYDRSVREMQALSDRDLADLGYRRSDIRRIARNAVYGGAV